MTFYRPQRSCGQGNVFTGVRLSTGGGVCLSACWDAIPPWMENPPRDGEPPSLGWRPPRPPLDGETTPPDGEPPAPDGEPPPGKQTPAYSIRSTSGRYASYWNAFLLCNTCMSPCSCQIFLCILVRGMINFTFIEFSFTY